MKTGKREHKSASLWVNVPMFLPPGQRHVSRELTHVHVPASEQKQGLGSELMRKVCQEADDEQTVLVLTAQDESLIPWYARFGFFTVQENIRLLARPTRQSLN